LSKSNLAASYTVNSIPQLSALMGRTLGVTPSEDETIKELKEFNIPDLVKMHDEFRSLRD